MLYKKKRDDIECHSFFFRCIITEDTFGHSPKGTKA